MGGTKAPSPTPPGSAVPALAMRLNSQSAESAELENVWPRQFRPINENNTPRNLLQDRSSFFSIFFLWNDKDDKIKRAVMINDYLKGGLKMIDITSFNKSLKATWIKKYLDSKNCSKWKNTFNLELEKYGGNAVFNGNLNKQDIDI